MYSLARWATNPVLPPSKFSTIVIACSKEFSMWIKYFLWKFILQRTFDPFKLVVFWCYRYFSVIWHEKTNWNSQCSHTRTWYKCHSFTPTMRKEKNNKIISISAPLTPPTLRKVLVFLFGLGFFFFLTAAVIEQNRLVPCNAIMSGHSWLRTQKGFPIFHSTCDCSASANVNFH